MPKQHICTNYKRPGGGGGAGGGWGGPGGVGGTGGGGDLGVGSDFVFFFSSRRRHTRF